MSEKQKEALRLNKKTILMSLVSLGASIGVPNAEHVVNAGLRNASDEDGCSYALANSAVLVTKDEDFPSRVWIDRQSPGLIWVTIGNCSNRELIAAFEQKFERYSELSSARKKPSSNYTKLLKGRAVARQHHPLSLLASCTSMPVGLY